MHVEWKSSGWVSKIKKIPRVVPIVRSLAACSVSGFLAPFVAASMTHNNAI